MKGRHHIIIEAPRLKYEFEIRRNLTVIRGDSATGKTTLIELLEDYRSGDEDSAVQITSDVPCRVFADHSDTWRQALEAITDSVVFIDEDNTFLRTKQFAEAVRGSSNYFVLITREALPELPYSINEIYGIRTSGKYHFPEQVYHEFYPLYEDYMGAEEEEGSKQIITEDAKAGYQFFQSFCSKPDICVGAGGNSNLYSVLKSQPRTNSIALIADGAAFGSQIEKVLEYADLRHNIMLYFPESFEWMVLKSGAVTQNRIANELNRPENYIDSKEYMSWEQYFTDLLTRLTKDDDIRRYQKNRLAGYYLKGAARDAILKVMPEKLQTFLHLLTETKKEKEVLVRNETGG